VLELNFITDLIEERLVKGNFRWLANFNEIHRDYQLDKFSIPIYATGGLEEKGFFLSKIFSALVTPKYKIHFLFYTSPEIDVNFLRNFIISCKKKFSGDDWIFIGLVQLNHIGKTVKDSIEKIADSKVGVALYSLTSKDMVSSENVLGKALKKQLNLAEAKFEAFDLPNYLKSFAMIFSLGTLMLVVVAFSFNMPIAVHPATLLLMTLISIIIGHKIYKTRYHNTLTLNGVGFKLQKGTNVTDEKWSNFKDVSIHITPTHETCIRLYSKEKTLDLPLSRVGMSRKEAYSIIKQLIKREQ
jgi:xanthosine utilization system XapX-like protein